MKAAERRSNAKNRTELQCLRIAERQFGLIHRSQALSAGMSTSTIDRRLRAGRWDAVLPCVYRIRGHGTSFQQKALAACLWAGEGAYCSDRTAAALWKLEGVATPGRIDITCTRRLANKRVTVHQRGDLISKDATRLGPIPTTVTRTLIDLAATAAPEEVEAALDHALRHRMTTLPRLIARLDQLSRHGRTGCALMKSLLTERSAYQRPPESELERRFLRLVRNAGLPKPEAQYTVTAASTFVARVDFAYPHLMIAVEMDSYEYHLDTAAFQHDRLQASHLASMGWLVLFFTSDDLTSRPDYVIQTIIDAVAVRARGAR